MYEFFKEQILPLSIKSYHHASHGREPAIFLILASHKACRQNTRKIDCRKAVFHKYYIESDIYKPYDDNNNNNDNNNKTIICEPFRAL